jgi:T-complex protein 1 subunit theta
MFESSGASQFLKEGSRHYSGVEETILRNIDACQQLAKMTRSALGPHGMNKMVINYLEKLFVTSDAATIMRETDIHHPAAKMIAQAAKMQDNEAGDGTNLLISIAGELMTQAAGLINMGLHPSEIVIGYEKASKKTMETLETLTAYKSDNIRNQTELVKLIKTTVASKQFGIEDFLSGLVAEACIHAMPRAANRFSTDNVRT